jgi:hypothetical protein
LLLIHPIVQGCGIVLLVYAYLMGLQRARSLHLNRKTYFPWKRHVLFGKLALVTLMAGMSIGLAMTRFHWDQNMMTMGHGKTGIFLLFPLILFGLVSGLFLDGRGKSRKVLQVLHGINNTALLLLVINQIRTGLEVYRVFASGL